MKRRNSASDTGPRTRIYIYAQKLMSVFLLFEKAEIHLGKFKIVRSRTLSRRMLKTLLGGV